MTAVTRIRDISLRLAIAGLVAMLLLTAASRRAQAQLTVAAAADLDPALRQIASSYEQSTGTRLTLVFGSSGNLTTQIENGAPYDVFLSADTGYPRRLVSEGRAKPDSFRIYAVGKLAIFALRESRLDLERLGVKALLDPGVRKIAIANPQHAPYGRAAVAALKNLGVYDQVAARLVMGENVSQAAQFVTSGNAQAGILALALLQDPAMKKKGQIWEIPQPAYPELQQAAVIVSATKQEAAQDFLKYLVQAPARAILQRYGFGLPGETRP